MQFSIGNKMYGLLLADILPGAIFCGELLVILYFYTGWESEIKFLFGKYQTIFCIVFLLLAIVFGLIIDLLHHIIYRDSKIKFETAKKIKTDDQIEIYQFFLVNIWYQYEFYANLSILIILNLIFLLIYSIEIICDNYIYLIGVIFLCLIIYIVCYREDEIKKKYLFSWEEVPGKDSEILKKFLMQNFNIKWIKKAEINKTVDNMIIWITNDTNFLSLRLNNETNNVNIEIDNGRTDKFIVKTINGKLNIYKKMNEICDRFNSYKNKCIVVSSGFSIIFLMLLMHLKEINSDNYLYFIICIICIIFISFSYFLYIKCYLKDKIKEVNEELCYRFNSLT